MLRKLMSSLLRADLEPNISWSAFESMETMARITVEEPRYRGRTETLEQVLCAAGDQYVLFKRWLTSGRRVRVQFGRSLKGREMRLTETQPAPTPIYRLDLCPRNEASVTYFESRPTWFRLWKNEEELNLGANTCFVDSSDRELLKNLRYKLLDGKIPESLRTEEAMWERMHSMPESDRRAAYAALAMKALGEADRKFNEMHPDLGPVPESLKPAVENMQNRIKEIEQTAAGKPVDPALADLMKRYVADSTSDAP
jgi:hypothetical protein